MKKATWASLALCALILCGGAAAILALRAEMPKQLTGEPLLAASSKEAKPLKEVIYETQKLVVMIETPDGMQGSGFLYNRKGDLITNAHVVAGASEVKVKTADARELKGRVIGIGTDTDVAVVRVPELADTEPLPIVRGKKAEIGDEVIAVGSPLGLQNTVTTGIVSGLGRSFDIAPYHYVDLYQISAPIAKGNSGGPLVDQKSGGVLGINSAGIEEGGIGFSIPIAGVLQQAEGWSAHPMEELPKGETPDQGGQEQEQTSIVELGKYLVKHFYDSLNSADYVYAYSLLGGNWKEGTSYEKFREGYIVTRNVLIDNMYVTSDGDDRAVVTAIISVDEREKGQNKLSKYQVTYEVGYENDQLKLLSGKGKAIE